IASHNCFAFVKQFVTAFVTYRIKARSLLLGDAGLRDYEIEYVKRMLPIPVKVIGQSSQIYKNGIDTQSDDYRKIISNRIPFLRQVFALANYGPVLQIDADTAIVSNNFSLVDP